MRKFIQEKLGANDLMAVIHVGGKSENSQEFTSSKRLLLAAVDKFLGKAERPATLEAYERYLATVGTPMADGADPMVQKRGFDARNTLEELEAVASWFGSVRGRKKSILFVSEGIDYDIEDVFGKQDASMIMDRTRDLIRSATKSNVSIYAIDPRGLSDMGDFAIELNGLPADGGDGLSDQQLQSLGPRGLQNELRLQHNSLRTLAEETGGFAVINTNSFENTFNRIVEENSSYYVLAYYPPNPKRDGKFHNIRVRVNRPGLTVRARRGYANPSGKAPVPAANAASRLSVETREALDSPLPVSGLTMQVFAAPFKGTAPKASVLLGVEISGKNLQLAAGDQLQLSYYAMDAKGKYQGGSTETVTLNLRPETKAIVEQTGLRALSRLELPPGRYQLRVAANELSSKAVGTVLYDLDVPDFSKAPISMSGLAITSPAATRLPTVRPDVELRQVLPAPPVAAREFQADEELALFAEVYDNTAAVAAQGRYHDDGDGGRRQGDVQDRRDARFVGPAGEERRLRLHDARAAQGPVARNLRAEGRGAVAARRRSHGGPSGAVSNHRAGIGAGAEMRGTADGAMLCGGRVHARHAADARRRRVRSIDKGAMSEVSAARQVDGLRSRGLGGAVARARAGPAAARGRFLPRDRRGRLPRHAPERRFRGGDRRVPRGRRAHRRAVSRNDAGSRRDHGAGDRVAVSPGRDAETSRAVTFEKLHLDVRRHFFLAGAFAAAFAHPAR